MNRYLKAICCCALPLLVASPPRLLAQTPNVTFEHLSAKEGLPGSAVYSITKDRQGFMWFGTRRCPTRYDGTNFRSFLFPETYLITGLAADAANRMWVASDRKGLCRIDPEGLKLVPVPNTPQVTGAMFIDAEGEGWFSHNDGVGRINLRTGAVWLYPFRQTNFFGLKAYDFMEDRQHQLWAVGSDNGLFRFDRRANRFVCVLGLDCSDPKRRFQLYLGQGCVGTDGFLWIGTYGEGLLRYDPKTDEYACFSTPDPANEITCVKEGCDENGQRILWAGDGQGLLIFRPEQQRFARVTGGRTGPFITHCLYRDSCSGIVWAGTSDGILKYNPQDNRIRTVALPPTLVRQPVVIKAILADRRDTTGQTFWLGLSHTGFLRWHRPTNRFTLIRFPSADSETTWFDQIPNGHLWIGLRRGDKQGDGVLVYDPVNQRYAENPATRQATKLLTIPYVDHGFVDAQNRLWVGNTDLGVRVLNSRTGNPIRYWPDSLTRNFHRNNNFLTHMTIDQSGKVWLATYKGLYFVSSSAPWFIRADDRNPKASQPEDPATNRVLVAQNGHIWAARWGSVTESRPDGKLLTVLTARDGLFDRENRQLAQDQSGTIWIGNFEGLHAYNPQTRKLWRLTTSDGLSHNNTTNALYVHRGTDVFIGQTNGFNYFDSRQLAKPRPARPVQISSFRVDEQERPLTQSIRLVRTDNAFSVDFSTLTYSRLPNTRYAYRLDGLETRWHYSRANPRASYTNLGPGSYEFQVKASDSFGRWSKQTTTVSINVSPAYYETGWFRAVVLLSVIGLLYGLYRYRINQLLRIQRIRNRISADLHDEIGSSLSSISILGTMANKSLPRDHPSGAMVARIVSEALEVSGSLDDIVWSINPHNDGLDSLIARMNRYAADLFEASGIDYDLRIPDTIKQVSLPMEQRQDFYLLFKEAINNLVKHARATRATVSISLHNSQLHLRVSDNGVGFESTQASERSGLRNMQARARTLKGTFTVRTAPGQGTTLQLAFPVVG